MIVAALGAVVTIGFMFCAGSPSDSSWLAGAPIFALWGISPYIIVGVLSRA